MTRRSAITPARRSCSALAYGSRSTAPAERSSTGSYTTSGDATEVANARQLPHVECGASSLPYDGQRNSLSGRSPARKDEFGAADLKA
jgi:hypothetical protein